MSYLTTNPKRCQNILTTVARMLEDRGYTLDEAYQVQRQELESDLTRAQRYYEQHECLMKAHQGEQQLMLVMAPKEEKLTIDTMRQYVNEYQGQLHTHVMVIIQSITPAARDSLRACKRFELFKEDELFRNKTQHEKYVPHRALSSEEEAALLKRYMCEKRNLPMIRSQDAIARYFAWPLGTIVEIKSRMGGAIEPTVSYRVVVDE